MIAEVAGIFIALDKGEPMRDVRSAYAMAGKGLQGDRYAYGKGLYQIKSLLKFRHITFIAEEMLELANAELVHLGEKPFTAAETRRNVLTRGIDLNAFVGKYFSIDGTVLIEGIELAVPCSRPPELLERGVSSQKAFKLAFKDCGGLRARILVGGPFRVGSRITPVDEDALMDFATAGGPGIRRGQK